MVRAGFYFDGFNFYHAVDDLKQPHLKWVSYARLARAVALAGHEVTFVKLFTALPFHSPQRLSRHKKFLDAQRIEGVTIIYGEFKERSRWCPECGKTPMVHEEKESDVNLAIHLLRDARLGLVDVAYLVTGDSDQAPAARMLRQDYPEIELVAVNTPGRSHCKEILHAANDKKANVSAAVLEACVMEYEMVGEDGVVTICPFSYRR
ncbi:MAG TPA: NYN domain-containing protein [Fimbriimonadaceae bacterium]|nr:NYN domain-containing protein [Fimbriimonadaceae bacterium]